MSRYEEYLQRESVVLLQTVPPLSRSLSAACAVYSCYGLCCDLNETSELCYFSLRSGSVHLMAPPVTKDPSFSCWLSWNMILG